MAKRIWISVGVFVLLVLLNTTTRAASAVCPCTIWPSSAVPSLIDQGPDSPVELGVTFHADANGYVTGIRFYKSAANTGTHIGNLWSSSGTLLATATFSNETASGWQQVNFSNPVAVTANTDYVASYHSTVGHYSEDDNYFATSSVDNAPLHAMANANGVLNGRYAYGSSSSFPNSTYNSASYWVDVVFNTAVSTIPVAPTITSQPASQTTIAGQTATFSVTATGTAPLTYQWRKNGANISGATASAYTTPTTSTDNGALFSIVVSNSAGSATSTSATLTVNVAAVAPSITSQPSSQTVTAGQTATFSVAATGTAPLSYQWRKNGANISGATSSSYTTSATTTADSGSQFSAVINNSAGSVTSTSAALIVNAATVAPTITSQPSSQTVTAGQTATFSVAATGSAPLSYQWRRNGVNISGATASTCTTPTTSADNGALFSAVVSNSAGSMTSSSATLTVNAAAVAPSITTQPSSQTVAAGQTATFSVAATGSALLSYQWRKNGASISGATSSSYTTAATTTADSGSQFSVVVSNSAGSITSNSATLTVTASSSCPCTIWSTSATPATADGGTDSPVELGFTFKSDTNGYITGIRFYKSTANTGTHVGNLWSSSGTLLATATFSGETASGWQQVNFGNPVAITANAAYVASYHSTVGHYAADENYFATSGVDKAPLHAVANGNGGLNGPYAYGSGSSFPNTTYRSTNYWIDVVFNSAVNTTPAPPTITSQPAGSTVVAGQTATFSVAATGSAPLSYQWRRNGANISGATLSTYTTAATVSTDNGAVFSVVVSNSAGSATSGNATLSVTAATRLLSANPTSLSFGSVSVSLNSILTTTLTNTGNSNVTVSNVSISGAGLTVGGISTGQIIAPGQNAILSATFLPALTGSVTGSAVITSNANNSPTTISLSGTGVLLVTHSATVSWTASSSSVTGYNVYSGAASGGPYTKITASPVAAVSYKDSTVQAGQTYYYVVTAVNSSNVESVYSNQVSAAIP